MQKPFFLVGIPALLLTVQFCYANLVVNGGFETDFTNPWGSPDYGFWMVYGEAEIVSESDGITPFEGSRMLHFLNPNRLEGSAAMDSMTWQLIDVSSFLGEISNGNVIAEMSTRFNRISGDSQTDTEFRIQIYAFAGSYSSFWPQYWSGDDLAHISESIFTDGDVGTWELATTELVLPVDTEFVAVGLQSIENIFNDTTGIEFDGHYADAVTLTIVPEPATLLLLGLGGLALLTKRKA
jgi:hypothetical protein